MVFADIDTRPIRNLQTPFVSATQSDALIQSGDCPRMSWYVKPTRLLMMRNFRRTPRRAARMAAAVTPNPPFGRKESAWLEHGSLARL